jgi:hypothetical protein
LYFENVLQLNFLFFFTFFSLVINSPFYSRHIYFMKIYI